MSEHKLQSTSSSGEGLALPGSGPVIVKIGGTTLEAQSSQRNLWTALAGMARREGEVSGGVVLVHGGGKAADALLTQLGFTTTRRGGIRITPPDQMQHIASVLAGSVNKALVGSLLAAGGKPVGLCLGDGGAIATRVATHYDFDPGRVGEVIPAVPGAVGDGALLTLLVERGYLPVLCSIGIDAHGALLNINADDAAAGVAGVLGASAVVLLTDVAGVMDAQGRVMPQLDRDAIEGLIATGVIYGGMIPKVRAALEASRTANAPVVILDGNRPEALAEWIQGKPVGTRINAASASAGVK